MTELEELRDVHAGRTIHVLGNGPSRGAWIVPDPSHVVIGCNAAYRDTPVDYLCAGDYRMLKELAESGYTGRVVTPWPGLQALIDRHPQADFTRWVPVRDRPPLTSSGAHATHLACFLGGNPIHLWGFDGGLDNLYRGTRCYPPPGERAAARLWEDVKKSFRRVQHLYPDRHFVVHGPSYLSEVLCGSSSAELDIR